MLVEGGDDCLDGLVEVDLGGGMDLEEVDLGEAGLGFFGGPEGDDEFALVDGGIFGGADEAGDFADVEAEVGGVFAATAVDIAPAGIAAFGGTGLAACAPQVGVGVAEGDLGVDDFGHSVLDLNELAGGGLEVVGGEVVELLGKLLVLFEEGGHVFYAEGMAFAQSFADGVRASAGGGADGGVGVVGDFGEEFEGLVCA